MTSIKRHHLAGAAALLAAAGVIGFREMTSTHEAVASAAMARGITVSREVGSAVDDITRAIVAMGQSERTGDYTAARERASDGTVAAARLNNDAKDLLQFRSPGAVFLLRRADRARAKILRELGSVGVELSRASSEMFATYDEAYRSETAVQVDVAVSRIRALIKQAADLKDRAAALE